MFSRLLTFKRHVPILKIEIITTLFFRYFQGWYEDSISQWREQPYGR